MGEELSLRYGMEEKEALPSLPCSQGSRQPASPVYMNLKCLHGGLSAFSPKPGSYDFYLLILH